MPTGVYDSSLITQRARAKAESNSFINRIQNPTNPRTSYGPLTGIYDNSEVNRVNNGQMKYFQRNGACTVAYIGCPCTVTTSSGEVANNVVIVAPGQVTGVTVTYGSIIVSWNTPTGTGPLTYTITTSPATTPVQVVNSTQYIYTNPTAIFIPGTSYSFFVQASNSAGSGTISTSSSIVAPYARATDILSEPLSTIGATITFAPYNAFTPITDAVVVVPGRTPTSISVSGNNKVTVGGGLAAASTYSNCTIRLTGSSGKTSDTSAFFEIKTNSVAPGVPTTVVPAPQSALCTLAAYSGFTGPITEVTALGYSGSPPYTQLSVTYPIIGEPNKFTINSLQFNTLYTVKISIGNGTYTSEFSSDFSVQTLPQPEPQIGTTTQTFPAGFTSAIFTFPSYQFNDGSTPTSATITNPVDGILPDIYTQPVGYDQVEITALLDPGVTYSNNLTLTLSNTNNTSPVKTITQIVTNPANANAPQVTPTSVGESSIGYIVDIGPYTTWTPGAGYVTANIAGSTQKLLLSSSYSAGPPTVSVTGLNSGTTYENIRLALTDNVSNFTAYTEPDNFTTLYPPPQNVQIPNSGRNTTSVKITFNEYLSFTISPGSSTVKDTNDPQNSLIISQFEGDFDQTFITIVGLQLGATYSGYYLTLKSTDGKTAVAVALADIIPTYPQPIITGVNNITETTARINYENYTALNPGNTFSSISITGASINFISSIYMDVIGLECGRSYSCTITLSNFNGSETSLPSEQFSFTTSSCPPPPSEPSPNVTSPPPDQSSQTEVTITYDSYQFNDTTTPNDGYFVYDSGTATIDAPSANSTTMLIQGLAPGITYTGYIVLTNGTVNSSQSNTFSFTTAP